MSQDLPLLVSGGAVVAGGLVAEQTGQSTNAPVDLAQGGAHRPTGVTDGARPTNSLAFGRYPRRG